MAKRAPDRFHVGQQCLLVLKDDPAFAIYHDLPCTVVEARRYAHWQCTDPSTGNDVRLPGLRYGVRVHLRTFYVDQEMLRPLDDDSEERTVEKKCVRRSTWAKFVTATGFDPRVKPAKRPAKEKRHA